ncbi:MAG: ABC transporter ATP-binding protein [Candidatus Tectomicrobia bacterium]|nr:ABC transporter ATP-binding protein [Candidatus Tectomicrobia bacterium]
MNALVVDQVSRRFEGLQALNRVSLTVQVGERRAIIGPNGAGKTTLFNIINGTLRPTTGRILLFDRDVTRLAPHRRTHLGLARTFQISALFPRLSVYENVRLAAQAATGGRYAMHRPAATLGAIQRLCEDTLKKWDLWHLRREAVRTLSYGDQRRIEIVLALATNPRLLLLDEPTAGLSLAETQQVSSIIQALHRQLTILLIEHDMDVTFELVDQVTVLHLGNLLADGPQEEVRRDPRVAEIYLGSATEWGKPC